MFFAVCNFFRSNKFGFPADWEVPGGFRKLREAWEKNFHQFSCKFIGGIPSYDPKPSEVNDYKSNDYFNVSVTLDLFSIFYGEFEPRVIRNLPGHFRAIFWTRPGNLWLKINK